MLSLPEIALQLVDKTLSLVDEDNARTLFLVGSKNAGKSTLLNSFLDKTDAPRETLVLEYSFGRRSNQKQGIEKTICHIWEYGGKLETLSEVLPSIPVTGKYYFCVMVDLSKIKSIWDTLETCIETMKRSYSESDKFPEAIIIIGGKYDIFKSYDSEIKKFICASIRSLALLYNAHVLFYSSKDVALARKAREMLQNAGFGNGINFKEKITNFAKPLAIPSGSDSWESIGISSVTLEQLKIKHLSRIPPEPLSTGVTISLSAQQAAHPEPTLDKLAAVKYEELRNMESLDICTDDYLQINKITKYVGHTRNISIPDCVEFKVTTNACRGFCNSWSLPSIMLGFKRHPVTSLGQCCNIMESEDVPVKVLCLDGERNLIFKSAVSCACYHCQKE